MDSFCAHKKAPLVSGAFLLEADENLVRLRSDLGSVRSITVVRSAVAVAVEVAVASEVASAINVRRTLGIDGHAEVARGSAVTLCCTVGVAEQAVVAVERAVVAEER
jgi:hypothetical protein